MKTIFKRLAQVILETTVAFIVLLMLLVGTTKLFVWFSSSLAKRHQKYEASRIIWDRGANNDQSACVEACTTGVKRQCIHVPLAGLPDLYKDPESEKCPDEVKNYCSVKTLKEAHSFACNAVGFSVECGVICAKIYSKWWRVAGCYLLCIAAPPSSCRYFVKKYYDPKITAANGAIDICIDLCKSKCPTFEGISPDDIVDWEGITVEPIKLVE